MRSPIERIETETGHWYRNVKTGLPVPGVTTVAGVLPKDKLQNWKLRKAVSLALKGSWPEMPADVDPVNWLIEAGTREANAAATVGTGAHDFAEKYMLGENPDVTSYGTKEQFHVNCFLQFVRDYEPKPILVEKVLVHIDPKTGIPLYCGTMDLIAGLNDDFTWLIDYKASSSSPRASHALQAAAYTHATHWIDDDGEIYPMPEVDKAAVVLLNGGKADKCYRMYRLDNGPVVFSVFKSLLKVYNFTKVEDRVVLGEV